MRYVAHLGMPPGAHPSAADAAATRAAFVDMQLGEEVGQFRAQTLDPAGEWRGWRLQGGGGEEGGAPCLHVDGMIMRDVGHGPRCKGGDLFRLDDVRRGGGGRRTACEPRAMSGAASHVRSGAAAEAESWRGR